MANLEDEPNERRNELVSEVGVIVRHECSRLGVTISPEAIMCVAEIAEAVTVERFAPDLEAFAHHAKKSTISSDDVRLLARRSEDVVGGFVSRGKRRTHLRLCASSRMRAVC